MNDDDLGYDTPDNNHGWEKCLGCRKLHQIDELQDGIYCRSCVAECVAQDAEPWVATGN